MNVKHGVKPKDNQDRAYLSVLLKQLTAQEFNALVIFSPGNTSEPTCVYGPGLRTQPSPVQNC